ncbi:hypothetical protein P3X46_026188 [Hevea brasiliensis]|uniref:RNase H type-1 domain-containing protein n=1 Tax=Hevea brasiliensis TaxID=3981 RepID=A0ABQ9KVT8_HEVBR|nr:hypothetical protein P3X46_026188 [Hevea brasiliensis]
MGSTYLHNWLAAQGSVVGQGSGSIVVQQGDGCVKWVRPPPGSLKCNVDASLLSRLQRLGTGWVVRDDAGRALGWLKECYCGNVVFELDSLLLVQEIRTRQSNASYFGSLVENCLAPLDSFPDTPVVFIKRSVNSVAHLLATMAGSASGLKEWGPIPPLVHDAFICDLLWL